METNDNIVQIKNIYIQLNISEKNNETERCQHNFSIRKFAAEMRKKNPKASALFASDGNIHDAVERLPPMDVPKFRWWRCPECRRNIESTSATEANEGHSVCCTKGLTSGSTSMDVPSHGETPMVLSGTQEDPTAQITEGIRDVDINAAPSITCFHDSQLSPGHQETNDAETGNGAASAGTVEPVIDKAGDIGGEETVAQIGNTITTDDDKGPTLINNEGNIEIPGELQQSADGSSAGIPLDAKGNSTHLQHRNRQIPSGLGDDSDKRLEVAVIGTADSFGVAPLQVEGSGNTSSESDQNKKHENPNGVSRRKRKLRYLTDLLGDKCNLRSDLTRDDDSSTHSKLVASSGSETHVSQGVAPCEDIGKDTKSPQRKRKMPQEEPEGITDPGIIGTHDSMSKADSERTVTDVAVGSSEIQTNASSGVHLQIGNKNERSKRKPEKAPALVKRKNKQTHVHDRFSPRNGELSSSKSNVKESDLRAVTANSLGRSLGTCSAVGKTDNHFRNSQCAQLPEREKSDDIQTASQISKFQPSYSKVGLDLSLNSFSEKIDSSVNKEKASTSKSVLEKNDLHTGQGSNLPASEPDLSQKKSQVWDLNERIAQNSTNLFEKRNFSLQKETSCSKEKTSDVQGCSKEINKKRDQVASNRVGRGSSDDIPMEIVELMAKNQYERGLADAGNQSFQHRINNNMKRFPEMQGMGPMTQLTKGLPGMTSFSPSNDARVGLIIGGANAVAAKGNSMNYSQMNRSHYEMHREKTKAIMYDTLTQNQQMLSRATEYCASASVRTGSQCSERAETLLSGAAPTVSFGFGIPQRYPPQHPESQHRGKTISDIRADELKRTQEAHSILPKPASSELNTKPKGPVDPYANECIPAMQLLSLMDGRSPGNAFNIGSSRPFAPCVYHPRYGTMERRDFLGGPLFQRHSRLGSGTFSVGESSGRSSGRNPFAFSGQRQEQDQSYLAKYVSSIPYTGQSSSRGKDKQKATLDTPNCIPYLQQNHGKELVSLDDEYIADVQPLGNILPEEHYCETNRNPAEFFLPDAGNPFTITWKDLKFPKRKYSRDTTHDGAKRQRTAKPKAGKEQLQNHPHERTK